ncbi:MAG: D-alanine--D-alanine ligase [Rhodospirillales bacterium]|nr:D-alanine--D-alanine ligase [Alphaproteobacteria bacterium]MCB9976383.1 D-alanine--D-alanine ligase [Rhodospirillales bacterium]
MSQTKNTIKKRVAVFFGGRSPEHDVSVVSGLQALSAIDQSKYAPFPVYIAPDGEWLVGDLLRERASYMLDTNAMKQVTAVTIDVRADRKGVLIPKKTGMFGSAKPVEFDVALPVFHGLIGEDGNIQGLFELANIPYTGMRTKASSILMDKVATKHYMQALDIPYLPYAALKRPDEGYLIPEEKLEAVLKPLGYPCILKPSHLGSSIGVAKVRDAKEAKACLPAIFEYDPVAIAEPFVENLVEYNVAVAKCFDGKTILTSAIERPKAKDELLDFKQKYLSGGGTKGEKGGGTKTPGQSSEGMLSLTREINPELPRKTDSDIRTWATRLFDALDGAGAPRIDFIGNAKTGQVWMNEVNPCPGSLGYFLWEAASPPHLFTDFLSALIEEAFAENRKLALPRDPVPRDARLFKRPL